MFYLYGEDLHSYSFALSKRYLRTLKTFSAKSRGNKEKIRVLDSHTYSLCNPLDRIVPRLYLTLPPCYYSDQMSHGYYFGRDSDKMSNNCLPVYFEDESVYYTIHPNLEETSMGNSIISANFGADLLLQMQKNALEQCIALHTYDDFDLIKESYDEIKKRLLGFRDLFHVKHNFSEDYKVFEFIKPNEFMIVLSEKESGGIRSYTLSRAIYQPKYNYIFEGCLQEPPKEPKVSWVTSIRDEHPSITSLPIKAPGTFNPLAYPGLGQSLDDFIKGYLESTSNILLMYSPPGTGKTTLLKHLLEQTRESCLITYSEEIKNMDSLFAYFLTSNEKFLIIEDADNYLTARSKDANNHSMKKLLNITDGLTSNPDKKVIFTTNLPNLNQVDTALLRPGRCYKALYFPYLSMCEAEAFLRSEGNGELPDLFASKVHKDSDTFSLASLHSYLNGFDPDSIVDRGTGSSGFGFTR